VEVEVQAAGQSRCSTPSLPVPQQVAAETSNPVGPPPPPAEEGAGLVAEAGGSSEVLGGGPLPGAEAAEDRPLLPQQRSPPLVSSPAGFASPLLVNKPAGSGYEAGEVVAPAQPCLAAQAAAASSADADDERESLVALGETASEAPSSSDIGAASGAPVTSGSTDVEQRGASLAGQAEVEAQVMDCVLSPLRPKQAPEHTPALWATPAAVADVSDTEACEGSPGRPPPPQQAGRGARSPPPLPDASGGAAEGAVGLPACGVAPPEMQRSPPMASSPLPPPPPAPAARTVAAPTVAAPLSSTSPAKQQQQAATPPAPLSPLRRVLGSPSKAPPSSVVGSGGGLAGGGKVF